MQIKFVFKNLLIKLLCYCKKKNNNNNNIIIIMTINTIIIIVFFCGAKKQSSGIGFNVLGLSIQLVSHVGKFNLELINGEIELVVLLFGLQGASTYSTGQRPQTINKAKKRRIKNIGG